MNALPQTIGNQVDAALPDSSPVLRISDQKLATLHDLLAALWGDKQLSMLRTTAGHISGFLNLPLENIAIDALVGIVPEFRAYLKQKRYKPNSANGYCNFAGMMLRKARELGWVESNAEVPKEWTQILSAVSSLKGARGIVNFAIRRGKNPATFTDDDLNSWAHMMLTQGKCYQYIRRLPMDFRRELHEAGLASNVSGIFRHWKTALPYFVPLCSFPAELRQEVEELLRWRQAPYVQTRRKKRLRAISARNLENAITRFYGFLVNVRPGLAPATPADDVRRVHLLLDLVTPDRVNAYVDWRLNVRNGKGRSVVVQLGALCSALKEHPNYKGGGFTWLDDLIRGIPYEPESSRRERKERKYLPYDTLAQIPGRIRAVRKKSAKQGSEEIARLLHDELVIQWLLILPWRQRNIRECRMGRKSDGANLFKAEIEQWDTVAKPRWVQEKLRMNPREQFWQYHFREEETKNGREVRSILPRRLVPLLEEYLEQARPLLLNSTDPGTLFLNEDGACFKENTIIALVSKLTLRHGARRVTPHIFRDIWAYWWLSTHPEDYLTVSKKLWHRNIQTTLRIYGCKFDESQADCRVEEWLDGEKST
jgi:integrase